MLPLPILPHMQPHAHQPQVSSYSLLSRQEQVPNTKLAGEMGLAWGQHSLTLKTSECSQQYGAELCRYLGWHRAYTHLDTCIPGTGTHLHAWYRNTPGYLIQAHTCIHGTGTHLHSWYRNTPVHLIQAHTCMPDTSIPLPPCWSEPLECQHIALHNFQYCDCQAVIDTILPIRAIFSSAMCWPFSLPFPDTNNTFLVHVNITSQIIIKQDIEKNDITQAHHTRTSNFKFSLEASHKFWPVHSYWWSNGPSCAVVTSLCKKLYYLSEAKATPRRKISKWDLHWQSTS